MSTLKRTEAERLLAEVPYRDRLRTVRMAMPSGMRPVSLRSLEEVGWFLEPSLRTLPGIRLENLADWIEKNFADLETADKLRRLTRESPSPAAACKAAWSVITARVEEARGVVDG